MYVICGISGNTGGAAAAALLSAGEQVRAFVRDASRAAEWGARGVELFEGDLHEPASLERAFAGAHGAYVLAPPNPGHPDPLGHYQEVAHATRQAAITTGLPRLVFLSSEGAHLDAGTGPIRGAHLGEGILDGAAPHVTFLRPSFFQENWRPVFGLAASQGVMPTLLQPVDARRSQTATADIGEAAAALLTEADPPRVVELDGPAPRSPADAAAAMAAAVGRPVSAVPVPREAWRETLVGAGLGEPYAALLCEMYEGVNSGHVRFSGEGESRQGRRTLEETVRGWVA